MSGIKFYILDTETNGLMKNFHEIVEVGIVRNDDRMQLWKKVKAEFPQRSSMDALAVTNKTMADLSQGISKVQAVEAVEKFLNEDGLTSAHRCIVAHNAAFDRRFLHAMWEQCGRKFPADLWLCTMQMTKAYAKQIGQPKAKVNLHAACDLAGLVKIAASHNAKVDSRNAYLLFNDLLNVKQLNHLPHIKTHIHSSGIDDEIDMSILEDE